MATTNKYNILQKREYEKDSNFLLRKLHSSIINYEKGIQYTQLLEFINYCVHNNYKINEVSITKNDIICETLKCIKNVYSNENEYILKLNNLLDYCNVGGTKDLINNLNTVYQFLIIEKQKQNENNLALNVVR